MFTPNLGENIHSDSYFSNGLKTPTRYTLTEIQLESSCASEDILFWNYGFLNWGVWIWHTLLLVYVLWFLFLTLSLEEILHSFFLLVWIVSCFITRFHAHTIHVWNIYIYLHVPLPYMHFLGCSHEQQHWFFISPACLASLKAAKVEWLSSALREGPTLTNHVSNERKPWLLGLYRGCTDELLPIYIGIIFYNHDNDPY